MKTVKRGVRQETGGSGANSPADVCCRSCPRVFGQHPAALCVALSFTGVRQETGGS